MDNSAQNANPDQNTGIQMPPSPAPQENSSSPRNTLLLIGSILVFVTIVGITLYLILQNQQSLKIASGEDQQTNTSAPNTESKEINGFEVIGTQNQAIAQKYGAICKRFTSIEEALKEIEVACILDLSNQNLTSLPSDIEKLSNLTSVNLANNSFSDFPVILYEFTSLTSIDLSNNNLSSLPSDILGRLIKLQSLKLEGNNLNESDIKAYSEITRTPAQ